MIIKIMLLALIIGGSLLSLNYLGWINRESKIITKVEAQNNQTRGKSTYKVKEDKILKLLDVLRSRPALSAKDKEAKAKIVNTLANEKANPYAKKFKDYTIDYIKSADEFLVEVNSPNTQQAKYWAIMWFKSNGISNEGLCKLPIMFYLSTDLADQLKKFNIEFNPIPDNC